MTLTASPFGPAFAQMYDAVYASKRYDQECDRLEAAFRTAARRPVRTVLDLGCGTGSHAIALASRGYHVVGVDRSPDMVTLAQSKATETHVASVEFVVGDLRDVSLGRTFDACIMMFAVLGYQTRNADVAAALANVQRHLLCGGLFVFDVWYGPAVLAQGPAQRWRETNHDGVRIVRRSSGTLDVARHVCHVEMHQVSIAGDRVVAETTETHAMRFFFPLELEMFLDIAGFEVIELAAFGTDRAEPDATTWNVIVVARRR